MHTVLTWSQTIKLMDLIELLVACTALRFTWTSSKEITSGPTELIALRTQTCDAPYRWHCFITGKVRMNKAQVTVQADICWHREVPKGWMTLPLVWAQMTVIIPSMTCMRSQSWWNGLLAQNKFDWSSNVHDKCLQNWIFKILAFHWTVQETVQCAVHDTVYCTTLDFPLCDDRAENKPNMPLRGVQESFFIFSGAGFVALRPKGRHATNTSTPFEDFMHSPLFHIWCCWSSFLFWIPVLIFI